MRYSILIYGVVTLGVLANPQVAIAEGGPFSSRQTLAAAGRAFDANDCVAVSSALGPTLAKAAPADAVDVSGAYDLSIKCGFAPRTS